MITYQTLIKYLCTITIEWESRMDISRFSYAGNCILTTLSNGLDIKICELF